MNKKRETIAVLYRFIGKKEK